MKITFILPMFLDSPAGGFKVVYEYANRLRARGHAITILHPRNIEERKGLIELIKSVLWQVKLRMKHRPLIPWFQLDREIMVRLIPDLRERFIPDAGAIVATAFETALPVSKYGSDKGRKFYLIQSWESWHGSEDEVRATWRLPLEKIVVSKWLYRIAQELGQEEKTSYIPIGLDFSQFYLTRPIGGRSAVRVAMMASPNAIKGTADGLAAIEMAKREIPDLQAMLFGVHPRDQSLPSWIDYVHNPTPERLRDLFNDCRVFIHPSWIEGWGLPAAEAMACGCTLVSTANEGVFEFAEDGLNALLSPIKRPDELGRNLLRVLQDDQLRVRLAQAGHKRIQDLGWERSVEAFDRTINRK